MKEQIEQSLFYGRNFAHFLCMALEVLPMFLTWTVCFFADSSGGRASKAQFGSSLGACGLHHHISTLSPGDI